MRPRRKTKDKARMDSRILFDIEEQIFLLRQAAPKSCSCVDSLQPADSSEQHSSPMLPNGSSLVVCFCWMSSLRSGNQLLRKPEEVWHCRKMISLPSQFMWDLIEKNHSPEKTSPEVFLTSPATFLYPSLFWVTQRTGGILPAWKHSLRHAQWRVQWLLVNSAKHLQRRNGEGAVIPHCQSNSASLSSWVNEPRPFGRISLDFPGLVSKGQWHRHYWNPFFLSVCIYNFFKKRFLDSVGKNYPVYNWNRTANPEGVGDAWHRQKKEWSI